MAFVSENENLFSKWSFRIPYYEFKVILWLILLMPKGKITPLDYWALQRKTFNRKSSFLDDRCIILRVICIHYSINLNAETTSLQLSLHAKVNNEGQWKSPLTFESLGARNPIMGLFKCNLLFTSTFLFHPFFLNVLQHGIFCY